MQQKPKQKPPVILPPQPPLGALAKKVREQKGEKEPEGGTSYTGRGKEGEDKKIIWNHDKTQWRYPGANIKWHPKSEAPGGGGGTKVTKTPAAKPPPKKPGGGGFSPDGGDTLVWGSKP